MKTTTAIVVGAAIVTAAILVASTVARYETNRHGQGVLLVDRLTGKVVICARVPGGYFFGYTCTDSADEILRRMEEDKEARR